MLTLGVIAWPRKRGTRSAPIDQVPTWKESIGMRNELSGVLPDEAKGNREPVNLVLREGCSCKDVKGRRWVDDDCPVHGLSGPRETDSKAEPRWMRQKRQFLSGEEGGRMKAMKPTMSSGDEDDENGDDYDDQ